MKYFLLSLCAAVLVRAAPALLSSPRPFAAAAPAGTRRAASASGSAGCPRTTPWATAASRHAAAAPALATRFRTTTLLAPVAISRAAASAALATVPRPATSPAIATGARAAAALPLAPGAAAVPVETYSYWVEPCSPPLARKSGCEAADSELADWALAAWRRASAGRLIFRKTADENHARLRIYWAAGNAGLYGEAMPIRVDGKKGAAVFVLPDVSQLGPQIAAACRRDALFRHAIVYLTCLHESGHAVGLSHTAAYDDIMYFFGFGGDVVEYFARYRRKLHTREDIRSHPGLSPADEQRLAALYPR